MRHGNCNGISNEEHFLKSFKGNTSDLTTGFPLIKEARQKLGMDLRKTPRGRVTGTYKNMFARSSFSSLEKPEGRWMADLDFGFLYIFFAHRDSIKNR